MILPFELLVHSACQAAQGMNFLHSSNPPIIHRDLKSHNILIDEKWNARISDFGITKFKDPKKSKEKKPESMGTIFWTAPEALGGKSHTEKSDCYSFGIVLWEMFHRKDPYLGKDIISVAMDVLHKGLRPQMDPNVPQEIQELIRECWDADPEKRPSFHSIMTRLRFLSMQHPLQNFTGSYSNIEPPSGVVYLVHLKTEDLFSIFDKVPRAAKKAIAIHTHYLRSNLDMYQGYEVNMVKDKFLFAFTSLELALNWCISTQVGLMRLNWPPELEAAAESSAMWHGMHVRMAVHVGTPNSEIDPASGRLIYLGAVVDQGKAMLRSTKRHPGSIIISAEVMNALSSLPKSSLVEPITTNIAQSGADSPLYKVVPASLDSRESRPAPEEEQAILPNTPHSEESPSNSSRQLLMEDMDYNDHNIDHSTKYPKWVLHYSSLKIKDPISKGQVGDFFKGLCGSKEVAVKVLVNQRLKEEDYFALICDSSVLSKVRHPNLLAFHGVCLKPTQISIVVDYVARGSLRRILTEEQPIPIPLRYKIARDIVTGLLFLANHSDPELHYHDNLKSNNILITKDWEVKISDYGQANIKDLARTMTSIASVAWTAPELLEGQEPNQWCAVYSFGIILWEIWTKKIPYENEHPLKAVGKILAGQRPPLPSDCPQNVKMLIESCWSQVPEQRPTWSVILTELSQMMMSSETV